MVLSTHPGAKWLRVVVSIQLNVVSNKKMTNSKSYLIPVLMLLGCFAFTIGIIVAGYFHGNMNIGAVWHNLNNFN